MEMNHAALDQGLAEYGLSLQSLRCYASFLGLGVIVGFIIKKYLKLAIFTAIIGALILKGLEFQGMVEIDWTQFFTTFNIDPAANLEEIFNQLYKLCMENARFSITTIVGFFIGYRAG